MKKSRKKKRDTFPSKGTMVASTVPEQIKDDLLSCGHYLEDHVRMHEAKASAEIEGAQTGKTVCELIDMANADIRNKKR